MELGFAEFGAGHGGGGEAGADGGGFAQVGVSESGSVEACGGAEALDDGAAGVSVFGEKVFDEFVEAPGGEGDLERATGV